MAPKISGRLFVVVNDGIVFCDDLNSAVNFWRPLQYRCQPPSLVGTCVKNILGTINLNGFDCIFSRWKWLNMSTRKHTPERHLCDSICQRPQSVRVCGSLLTGLTCWLVVEVPRLKKKHIPHVPCIQYFPTTGQEWPRSKGNVGKYSTYMEHLGISLSNWIIWMVKASKKNGPQITSLGQQQQQQQQQQIGQIHL